MFQLLKSITSSRACWFLLLLISIALEGCGLYFQYKLELNPCVNCVYERAYFLGFVLLGFLGAFLAQLGFFRFILSAAFLACSTGGLLTAIEHFNSIHNASPFGSKCAISTNFPSFLPLDELLPFMFKSFGACEKLDWAFLGQDMPFWILIIFSVSTVIAFLMFISNFYKKKNKNFSRYYR